MYFLPQIEDQAAPLAQLLSQICQSIGKLGLYKDDAAFILFQS